MQRFIIIFISLLICANISFAQDKAKEASVKSVMHSVQLAIEGYNLENNTFPIATNTAIASLVNNYLKVGAYMVTVPKNPFTGAAYTDAEVSGKIIYDYNNLTGVYTITGYKRDGKTKILELTNM